MPTYSSLISGIDEALASPGRICLWYSGGSDSQLLLEAMLKAGKPFGILLFQDGWTRRQKAVTDKVREKHNLQIFSYPALDHLLASENGEVSLVSSYAIGDWQTFPIIRDLVDDPARCLFDVKLETPKMKVAPIEFDTHILGTRKADRHWLFGGKELALGPVVERGTKKFLYPLWDWTKDEVTECLKRGFGLEVGSDPELGDLPVCSRCLCGPTLCPKTGEEIQAYSWQPADVLRAARARLIGE